MLNGRGLFGGVVVWLTILYKSVVPMFGFVAATAPV
jgi:hypothetical protein